MWSFLLFNFVLCSCAYDFVQGIASKDEVDEAKTLVWGPGLDPENVVLKARYIFLQLVNKDGKNITESVGKDAVSGVITGDTENGQTCHVRYQTLDCKDGSYIIRYRAYDTCTNLKITLRVLNKKLKLKKSKFKGPIYEEECYCPTPSLESWIETNECNPNNTQILNDLELFPSVDFDILRSKIISMYDKPYSISICHYVIKSNKIYRQCYGEHVGFKMFVDTVLLSLTRKTVLPDVEFFMNLGDWPLVPKDSEIYPIFSWCGSDDSHDIVLPTYDITESSIKAMDSVMLDMLSVQGSIKLDWNNKINKVFWRGRDSRRERLDLIDIARANPDLFNATITNFFFFKDEIEKYGPEQKHVSFFDFFEYKYQLNIDGTVAAYRFPYLLAGDSLVFKQKSKYYEFFYKDLEEDKHYISVKRDLSDLVKKVNWALNNDDKAYNISREARKFTRNNLMPQHIICYYVALIEEWSKRLKRIVRVLPGMEHVPQPENNCVCKRNLREKDEL